MSINIKLHQLATFAVVAETASFREAAERLNLSQSTVSVRIRELEDTLGLRVLHRTTRAVSLTAEGERLLAASRQALKDLERLSLELREEGALKRGRFALAALPSVAATILPPLIEAFGQRHPGVRIDLLDCVADRAVASVLTGDVTFAISSTIQPHPDLDFVPLFEDECLVVVPRSHRLARQADVSIADLTGSPLLVPVRGSGFRATLDAILGPAGVDLNSAREAVHLTTLMAFAEAGMGLSFVPSIFVKRLDLSRCVTLSLQPRPIWRTMGVVAIRNSALPPAADGFIAFMREALDRHGGLRLA